MGGEMTYAVVQTQFEPIPPPILQSVLEHQGELLPLDARSVANRRKGILYDQFTAAQAEAVASALNGANFHVRVMPTAELPAVPKMNILPWLMFSSAGMAFPFGLDQALKVVEWPSVFLINSSLIHLREERQVRRIASNEPDGAIYETEVVSKPTPVTDVIVLATDGDYMGLRIIHGRTRHRDGESLANKRTSGKSAEYTQLLETIVSSSTDLVVSPTTQQLLVEQRNVHQMPNHESWVNFEERAFKQYTRWLLLMVLMKEDT